MRTKDVNLKFKQFGKLKGQFLRSAFVHVKKCKTVKQYMTIYTVCDVSNYRLDKNTIICAHILASTHCFECPLNSVTKSTS